MKTIRLIAIFLSLSLLSLFASDIQISKAYVRAMPPQAKTSAAFMLIKNNSDKDIYLLSAKSNISKFAELHNVRLKDGMMAMYQVPKILIKAHSTTSLKSGSFHIMLISLKTKFLKAGQKIKLNLKFSNTQMIDLILPVKKITMGHMKMKMKNAPKCKACNMEHSMKNSMKKM